MRLRHPLRIALFATAAWCSAGALTGTAGIVAAMVGAVLGVVLGEYLARRQLRLWVIASGAVIAALVGLLIAHETTERELLPDMLGPARAIRFAAIVRYGVVALTAVTILRAAARRIAALGVVEVIATAAAVAIPFAAHRDGQIARPLWLSDWAWRHAIDPATVLVAIGVGVAVVLAILLMLDAKQRPSMLAVIALPVIAGLCALLFATRTPPPENPPSEYADLKVGRDDEHRPPPQGSGSQPRDGSQGSGQKPAKPDNGGGGGAQQQQGSGGGQQGSGQESGQQPPPPPSEWQDPSQGDGKSVPMAIVLLGDDYRPPSQAYYFREEVWSDRYGARLVPPRDRSFDTDVPGDEPRGTLKGPSAPDAKLQPLHADVALMIQHRKSFFLGEPTAWEPLTNPDPSRFVRMYRFEAAVSELPFEKLLGRHAGDDTWPSRTRDYFLAGTDDPRFAELAQQIVTTLPQKLRDDPFARAAAIKKYLEHNVSYSLSHRHAGVTDPVADFLFGDRIGYCVHIAHAAVYLWRAAGIPSRIGVGYMIDADKQRGSSVMLRAGDAHAWPELYLNGIGWVVFDIAPETNLDPPGKPTDEAMQQQLAELARGQPPKKLDDIAAPSPERRALAGPIALGSCVVLALALLVLYGIKIWRRLAPAFAPIEQLSRVAYRTALDLLADTGHGRELGETREHFARRVGDVAPAFSEITTLHLAARLGPPGTARPTRRSWRELLIRLRRELATRAPLGKRITRALHPISFRLSR